MSVIDDQITPSRPGEQFEPTMNDEFAQKAIDRARRLEAVVPGITRLQLAIVLLLAGVYLMTSFYALHHTDLWAHLGYGRAMAESGRLLFDEPFGIPAASEPFLNIPWLAQWAGYELFATTGAAGLRFAHAALALASVTCLMLAVRARKVNWIWAMAAGATCYLLSSTVVGVIRPQLFGAVGLPLALLAAAQIGRSKGPLYWLPAVFLLWANLHGSFVLGLFVIAAVLGESLLAAWRRTSSLRAAMADGVSRRIALLLTMCLVATLINPAGFGLWWGVLGFSGQANLADIVEWRPMVVKSVGGMMFLVTMLITAVLLRVSPRRLRPSEIVLAAAFGLAALLSMRMIAWWAFLWPWLAAPHLAAIVRRYLPAVGRGVSADTSPVRTLAATAAVFLALVWAPASHAWLAGRPLSVAEAVNHATPFQLAVALDDGPYSGAIFTPLDWADFLIWKTDAQVKPLVYSHVHLVEPSAWNDYQQMSLGAAGWLAAADRHEIRYLVLPHDAPLRRIAWTHPRVELRYIDQQGVILELLPEEEEETVAGD